MARSIGPRILLGPSRRREGLGPLLEVDQVLDLARRTDQDVVALGSGLGVAEDDQDLAVVAGDGVLDRAVPLDPLQPRGVPEERVAHRGDGLPVVVGLARDGAEHLVHQDREGVDAAESFGVLGTAPVGQLDHPIEEGPGPRRGAPSAFPPGRRAVGPWRRSGRTSPRRPGSP